MSRAGTLHENAVIESIFGGFKEFLRAEYFSEYILNIMSILILLWLVLYMNLITLHPRTNLATKALSILKLNKALYESVFCVC